MVIDSVKISGQQNLVKIGTFSKFWKEYPRYDPFNTKAWGYSFYYLITRITDPPIMADGNSIARNNIPIFFVITKLSFTVSTWSLTSSAVFTVFLMFGLVSGSAFMTSHCGSGDAPNTILP